MKIKLRKCQICADWYSPFRAHCPNCGASPIRIADNIIHFDAANEYRPGIIMGSATTHYHWSEHMIFIAQELCR